MHTKDVGYLLRFGIACCGLVLVTQVDTVKQAQGASERPNPPEVHAQVVMPMSQDASLHPAPAQITSQTSTSNNDRGAAGRTESANAELEWSQTLLRHSTAIAFELLLIVCLVLLRIHEKRSTRHTGRTTSET
jgi:hypothetical protein